MDQQIATDEALLLKGYDSARDGRAILPPQGAFEYPVDTADIRPGDSKELGTIAFHAPRPCAD
jgi:hypothetical protein